MTPVPGTDRGEGARVEIYGIRHHGPGSARAVRGALEEFKPDAVLIEGPPEADAIVDLAGDAGMVPPVALLAYTSGRPAAPAGAGASGEEASAEGAVPAGARERQAAFWPFAEFSPEWQAIRYALEVGVPVRFCDLPAAHQLAEPEEDEPQEGEPSEDEAEDEAEDEPADEPAGRPRDGTADDHSAEREIRMDPLGWLARAAGYDDAERWWDDVVEHRHDGPSPFPAIAEAMAELRDQIAALPAAALSGLPPGYLRREERREAHMRRTLRRTLKDGHERVAVVCGAWHVPALRRKVPATRDDQTLRGLPKAKIEITWVPWTHGRLAGASGYGAGVRSPGWYHHLFTAPDRPIERWLTQAARVLREEDLHVSSAHVIEAVRLADALAALRGRPLAGLEETTEATRAVLCEGADLPVELIQRKMVVGERLGSVPEKTPMVPLKRDLRAQRSRLRLAESALEKKQDLDLRRPIDLDRSRLLHRLRLLDIDWGVPQEGGGRSKGTFRESWTLMWRPEFDVELIEASAWGTTVLGAATARAEAMAANAATLADLTSVAERCLLADLGAALPAVMRALADRAALDSDVAHLMAALPALVRALRYGDVRGTPVGPLRTVVDGLVVRVCVGLPPAVSGLDDDAARELLGHVDAVHGALALLDDAGHLERWRRTLAGVIDRQDLHGLLEGRLSRLLLDAGRLPDVAERMARSVSVGAAPERAAAWVEGFLSGGGLILVHDDGLLRLVDEWITGLPGESFTDVLPLLRRTFGGYAAAERRSIGERVRHLDAPAAPRAGAGGDDLDPARAGRAAAAALRILGWKAPV
ncbi:DUF5682 family protein [Actinomadura vinacea]|uniref:DUF5682 family protein n=1 Tax=Actinomadura vinacea TaxID=115336 RepID=A0ABN3IZ97_9ACTN